MIDQTSEGCICLECEESINQVEKLLIHPSNLILIRYEKDNKSIMQEIFSFSFQKYINSETNLDDEDIINCSVCNETLNGDTILWFSLVHLFKDSNINENLIICNRKCFPKIMKREEFNSVEQKRIESNCIDKNNFIFRKIILPSTGY